MFATAAFLVRFLIYSLLLSPVISPLPLPPTFHLLLQAGLWLFGSGDGVFVAHSSPATMIRSWRDMCIIIPRSMFCSFRFPFPFCSPGLHRNGACWAFGLRKVHLFRCRESSTLLGYRAKVYIGTSAVALRRIARRNAAFSGIFRLTLAFFRVGTSFSFLLRFFSTTSSPPLEQPLYDVHP